MLQDFDFIKIIDIKIVECFDLIEFVFNLQLKEMVLRVWVIFRVDEGGDVFPVGLKQVDTVEWVLVDFHCLDAFLGGNDFGALYNLCWDLSTYCLDLLFHFLDCIISCGDLFFLRAETTELFLESGSVVYEFC